MSTNKKFTGEWVLRNSWNDDAQALNVVQSPSETEISISAESDSIQTRAMGFVVMDNNPVSCIGMSKCALYVLEQGPIIQISPSDIDDFWISLPPKQGVHTICARRIRVEGEGKFYLVVQA